MTHLLKAATFIALLAGPVQAAPEAYTLDTQQSQVEFSYSHVGQVNNWGRFNGLVGTIVWDIDQPAASSVQVIIPANAILTGWESRFRNMLSQDYYDRAVGQTVKFSSTTILPTGHTTAQVTGDLTLNGVTRPVILDVVLVNFRDNPRSGQGRAEFVATTSFNRSEFDFDALAPLVGDRVELMIRVAATKVR